MLPASPTGIPPPRARANSQTERSATARGSSWRSEGFGKVAQELREFDTNKRVRLVPSMKFISGGHRFFFTAQGGATRIDHELEMTPKGLFKIFSPFMGMTGKKNLRDTANALQRYLERT